MKTTNPLKYNNESGAVLIMVVCAMVMLLGMAALAIDVSHLVVARNELKNAADAGALAAARVLYSDDGTSIEKETTESTGKAAAEANKSENVAVEVKAVEIGHWSFGLNAISERGFETQLVLNVTDISNFSEKELDGLPSFINAVKVSVERKNSTVASYFAQIFGIKDFEMEASSIAYIGFAGTLFPEEVDLPIAICSESLWVSGKLACNIGRMINSGNDDQTSETAGWTDFNQNEDGSCPGNAKNEAMSDYADYCTDEGNTGVNPKKLTVNTPMSTRGGEIQGPVFGPLYKCWIDTLDPDNPQPVKFTLPVIDCDGKNPGPCNIHRGAVSVTIVWVNEKDNIAEAPEKMGDWDCDPLDKDELYDKPKDKDAAGERRWISFTNHFDLVNPDGITPATYAKKSIYFLPLCHEDQPPIGLTGGRNYGILAKIPVLVD
ncbi:MAG: TadG family pilus assembly protein [Desulfobacterales bacterium]|nr:TadG family pilus assembly protein [Desulfobacterales bacterium]